MDKRKEPPKVLVRQSFFTSGVLHVGASPFAPSTNLFAGTVDEVRSYNQPLSATAIRAAYDEAVFGSDAYWAFDSNLNDAIGRKQWHLQRHWLSHIFNRHVR